MKNNHTLRKQFLVKILTILLAIAVGSGALQLYFMKKQIDSQTHDQAEEVANNVLRGLEDTDLASKTIEHQIDLKLVAYSKHIADLIKNKKRNEISNGDLIKIKNELGLAGITVFTESESKDDIVGFAATEKEEVGFSFKKAGFYEIGKVLLQTENPSLPGATYTDKNIVVLPLAQSASHKDKPTFFKYAYYHVPNTRYIINPYIEANEVYNYLETAGPSTTINKLVKDNKIIEEIGILNPKVFKNPLLEKKLYPPTKKIEAGSFQLQTNKFKTLVSMPTIKKATFIENIKGKKIYKMFLPLDENRVIYLALDYGKMSGPLYRHSIILIVSSIVSLIALFLMTAGFFNQVYENIQKIIGQINLLENGDLTVKSKVDDRSELDKLSKSTNRMVDKLNNLVKETQDQATKTQRLSLLLEAEASQSVKSMYDLSTKTTIMAREQLFEIMEFLDDTEQALRSNNQNEKIQKILKKLEAMREMAQNRTYATTEITITLSDLLKSLHGQSSELSEISNSLLEKMDKFKL
jgi:methyl-accepting chemotaxis protein